MECDKRLGTAGTSPKPQLTDPNLVLALGTGRMCEEGTRARSPLEPGRSQTSEDTLDGRSARSLPLCT